jgi:gentisate 1,2-dioxygenase
MMAHVLPDSDLVTPDTRRRWASSNLAPLWEMDATAKDRLTEEPRLWRWDNVRPILDQTTEMRSPRTVERRAMKLVNSSIPGDADATAGLLNATYQALLPGETARPHRHSMNAFRFVLEGSGVETIVNGKACRMEVGDLILTPAWTWHEHHHRGDGPAFWLDVLDVPLHRALGACRFEPGPVRGLFAAHDDEAFRAAALLPVLDARPRDDYSPVFRYPWVEVARALDAAPPSSDGARRIRYVNPLTGGACMALVDCFALELRRASATARRRSTSSAICSVVEGEGRSRIGDTVVEWKAKDTFTIPQGAWVSHECGGEKARVFVATNDEAFRRLGLLTEETDAPDR